MAEDFEPTPMMTDVLITPTGQEVYGPQEELKPPGTPFNHNCLPDTGCSASMIFADLVRTYGLVLDRQRTRKLKNVNGTPVKVIGSVTFEISYEGANVEIIALVSTDLEDEIILPWRKLKKLGIISDRFPCPLKIFKPSRQLKRQRRNGRLRSQSVLVVTMYSLRQAFMNTMVSMINNKIMAKRPGTTLNSPKRTKLMSRPHAVQKLATSNIYSAKPVNASDRE